MNAPRLVPASASADTRLAGELTDIERQADGACGAATPNLSDLERRLTAARTNIEALPTDAAAASVLLQKARRASDDRAWLNREAAAFAEAGSTAALIQAEARQLRDAGAQVEAMRRRLAEGVKRFYGVNAQQDEDLRAIVRDASPLTIDVAPLAAAERAAAALSALAGSIAADFAKRPVPACTELATLLSRWNAATKTRRDLLSRWDDVSRHVAWARDCISRRTAPAPPVAPPAPAPSTPAAERPPAKGDCVASIAATVASGRDAYQRWTAVGREKAPWVFVCGSWSAFRPCMPSAYEAIWTAVDGKVPKDQWGNITAPACEAAWSGPSVFDFQQCAWREYLAKLDAWAAKKTAECAK